jgi:hypothetical protein
LSKGGVAPRTAQAAMRHSTLELTMNTYTDPRRLDVAGALEVVPKLPLDDRDGADCRGARCASAGDSVSASTDPHSAEATDADPSNHGHDYPAAHLAPHLAPALAPNGDSRGQS